MSTSIGVGHSTVEIQPGVSQSQVVAALEGSGFSLVEMQPDVNRVKLLGPSTGNETVAIKLFGIKPESAAEVPATPVQTSPTNPPVISPPVIAPVA